MSAVWFLGPAFLTVGIVALVVAGVDMLRTSRGESPIWDTIRCRDLALAGSVCLFVGTILLVAQH
jgi:hypothetical protein